MLPSNEHTFQLRPDSIIGLRTERGMKTRLINDAAWGRKWPSFSSDLA